MAKYRKKSVVMEARQVSSPEFVYTVYGRVMVQANAWDWVLTNPLTGYTWVVNPDIFEQTYEKVEGEDG